MNNSHGCQANSESTYACKKSVSVPQTLTTSDVMKWSWIDKHYDPGTANTKLQIIEQYVTRDCPK